MKSFVITQSWGRAKSVDSKNDITWVDGTLLVNTPVYSMCNHFL